MAVLSVRALLPGVLVAALSLLTSVAQAQDNPSFDAALELMRKGDFVQACPKLEEALVVDKSMIVRFRLAECYEQIGKLATSLHHYREVIGEASLKGMAEREAFAKKKAGEVEARVPKLKLIVPPEVGQHAGLQIAVDGEALLRDKWAEPKPLDLGAHQVMVSGPGYRTWTLDFELTSERELRTIQVPDQTEASPVPSPTAPLPAPGPTPDAGGGLSTQAIAGIAVAAGGLVIAAVGIGVGIAAKNKFDDSLVGCNEQNQCDTAALDAQDSAVTLGNISTVLVVVGAAATVGGVIMWIIAPDDDEVAFGVTPGGVQLRGTF